MSRLLKTPLATAWRSSAGRRSFATSPAFHDAASNPVPVAAVPVRKPVGAFRGAITGFLLGSVAAGFAMYSYVLKDYRTSNELLNEDLYALQSSVQRIEAYVKVLEDKLADKKK